MLTYGLMIVASVAATGIGYYFFLIAMSQTIKGSLIVINRNVEGKPEQKCIWEQLIEFLEYHSNVKQLSEILFFFN